ncbi:MAG: diacylglycerol kinase family lipid kinase [Planctomycetes bacterium]|nr:diacylglycerol kinase family lipid kinase [Planctomycetota bacterium]
MTLPVTLAVVNPHAGGGRCGRKADEALARLAKAGVSFEVARTERPGHAIEIVREAYGRGVRRFLSVGGDGTAFEVVNGLSFGGAPGDRATLGFLPLGTGNSFLRDFDGDPFERVVSGRTRPCDVVRVGHAGGEVCSINLVALGFPADVGEATNRRFKWAGPMGYVLGVLSCLARRPRHVFPLRADGADAWEREPCLMLVFANSRFTGGRMMIAPDARPDDGLVEFVRLGPLGRLSIVRRLPRLFDGTYVRLPGASRRGVRRVEFDLPGPVGVMIDGEVLRLHCRSLEVLPGRVDVLA